MQKKHAWKLATVGLSIGIRIDMSPTNFPWNKGPVQKIIFVGVMLCWILGKWKTESQKFASPCNNYYFKKNNTCRNPRAVAIHLNWNFWFSVRPGQSTARQDTHLSMRAAKKAAPSESAFQKCRGKFAMLQSDKMRVVSWNLEIILLTRVYMIIKHSEGAIPTQL